MAPLCSYLCVAVSLRCPGDSTGGRGESKVTAAGDARTHPNTAAPIGLPDTAQSECSEVIKPALGDSSINVQRPICPFNLLPPPPTSTLSGYLNLSKPFQRGQNCDTLVHPSAKSVSCAIPNTSSYSL